MQTFQKRQDAFENKFKHDQELIFKTNAKTTKLFGLWAAENLGLEGDEAESYAEQLVIFDVGEPSFHDVMMKVTADLPDISKTRLDLELDRCAELAHKAIEAE